MKNILLALTITLTSICLAPAAAQEQKSPTETMILPVVRLYNDSRIAGTAFIARSPAGTLYVIAAKHCVVKEELWEEELEGNPKADIKEFVNRSELYIQIVHGSISQNIKIKAEYISQDHDFAILGILPMDSGFLPGDQHLKIDFPIHVVKLASEETYSQLQAFDYVYVVGFPISYGGQKVSSGILFMEEGGHLGTNAPVIFGNSGSPLFDAKSGEVIGIVKYLYVAHGTVLTHISGATSIIPVKKALEELDKK